MTNNGTLTLSLEIELGWGFHDLNTDFQYISHRRERETETLKQLLVFCDKKDIPISFDIVGHLFLSDCDGEHETGPAQSWFSSDPGSTVESDPLFYAPDLVEMIVDAKTDHEICTHTFSHVLCDQIAQNTMERELEKVFNIHDDSDIAPPTSFVPPRHRPVQKEILKQYGIQTVRIADESQKLPENPLLKYLSSFTATAPVRPPRIVDGMLETYCSPHPSLSAQSLPTGPVPAHPAYRILPTTARQRLHKRMLLQSLKRTTARNSFVHHWTHLHNMSNRAQWEPIKSFLQTATTMRNNGSLQFCTMDSLRGHPSIGR